MIPKKIIVKKMINDYESKFGKEIQNSTEYSR
jgi:hypothetical protein